MFNLFLCFIGGVLYGAIVAILFLWVMFLTGSEAALQSGKLFEKDLDRMELLRSAPALLGFFRTFLWVIVVLCWPLIFLFMILSLAILLFAYDWTDIERARKWVFLGFGALAEKAEPISKSLEPM